MDNAHESMRDMIDVVGADGDVEMPTPDEPAIPAIKSRISLDDGPDECPGDRLTGIVDKLRGMTTENIPPEKLSKIKEIISSIGSMISKDDVIEESGELSLDNMSPKKDKAGRPQHNRGDGQSYQQKNGWLG